MGKLATSLVAEWICVLITIFLFWLIYLIGMGFANIMAWFCFGGY